MNEYICADSRDAQIATLTAKLAKVREIAEDAKELHFHDTQNVDRAANGYRAIMEILREVGHE